MTSEVDRLIAHCREAGRRITGQRRIIAEIFAHATDHPDISQLHRRVMAVDPRISLSTVYRTLKVFSEKGLVERHSFTGKRAQVEMAAEHHHDHLIDIDTGVVVEFRSEAIERLQAEIARELGFGLTSHKLVLYGRRLSRQHRSDDRVPSNCE